MSFYGNENWVCARCGSKDIEKLAWVDARTGDWKCYYQEDNTGTCSCNSGSEEENTFITENEFISKVDQLLEKKYGILVGYYFAEDISDIIEDRYCRSVEEIVDYIGDKYNMTSMDCCNL